MKEILIISGKGGTGKTTLISCFAALAKKSVIADCDVDAADLHLILNPKIKIKEIFTSGKVPKYNLEKCRFCKLCVDVCRFNAIKLRDDSSIEFNLIKCEGCGFCARVCKFNAITMLDNKVGEIFNSESPYGPFIHAKLGVAAENSGKLVSKVREKAKEEAKKENLNLIIIDGSPGIGCPVIASLTGVNLAIIVLEPSLSGLHDGKRIIEVCNHFNISKGVIINKYDLNEEISFDIENFCKKLNIPVFGKIPFDKSIVDSLVNGKIFVEHKENSTSSLIKEAWKKITEILS